MEPSRKKKWLSNLARVVVSLGILGWIVWKIPFADHVWKIQSVTTQPDGRMVVRLIDPTGQAKPKDLPPRKSFDRSPGQAWVEAGFLSVCRDIRLPWLAAAFAVFWLAPALQAQRWRRLLHVQDVHLTVGTVLKLMWVGLFFNLFLLGAVGGDLIKAYYVSHHATRSRAESVITVLVDRIIGLLGLVWLSAVAMAVWLIWRPGGGEIEGGLPWAWLIPGVVVLLGAMVFYARPMRRLLGIDGLVGRLREDHMVRRLDRAVYLYRDHRAIVGEAFGWSFLAQMALLLTVYFVLRSLGVDAPGTLARVLILAPLIFVATGLIPSVGGLGIQEFAFVLFFAPLVVGADGTAVALAASLVYRLVNILWSLPGAAVMMIGTHLPSRAEMKREMGAA